MGCHPSHWRTHIFQDGYCTTNQQYEVVNHCCLLSSAVICQDQHEYFVNSRGLEPLSGLPEDKIPGHGNVLCLETPKMEKISIDFLYEYRSWLKLWNWYFLDWYGTWSWYISQLEVYENMMNTHFVGGKIQSPQVWWCLKWVFLLYPPLQPFLFLGSHLKNFASCFLVVWTGSACLLDI